MALLLAAPDKFRGTASAAEVAAGAARAARSAGWSATELPLADGGEGTLDVLARALSGERRRVKVHGPLGEPVEADWLLVPDGLPKRIIADLDGTLLEGSCAPGGGDGVDWEARPVAVVESARAVGRALLPAPEHDEPVRASTRGVGELILAAVVAGARLVIVGTGGTATTDGGAGALSVLATGARLQEAQLVVACDVTAAFRSAAETFAPQKGATPAQVARLRARLNTLAERYRRAYGVDVDRLAGSGAAGGLAGGLAVLGARLAAGFAFVATVLDLDRAAAAADLVVTGEGRLDATSFDGKVVGGVLQAAGGIPPALCVAGEIDPGMGRFWSDRPGPVDAVSLVSLVGIDRARRSPVDAVFDVVAAACTRSVR